jgi:hypothetical protein
LDPRRTPTPRAWLRRIIVTPASCAFAVVITTKATLFVSRK